VAEELVFEQLVGDRRAVDGQERGVGVVPRRVQGAGDQLLAGAGLPQDQDVGPGRPDLADQGLHRLHRRALADECLEVDRRVQLAAEGLVLQREPAGADQAVELGEQLLEDHRLE
jgi:hypothetical protein